MWLTLQARQQHTVKATETGGGGGRELGGPVTGGGGFPKFISLDVNLVYRKRYCPYACPPGCDFVSTAVLPEGVTQERSELI